MRTKNISIYALALAMSMTACDKESFVEDKQEKGLSNIIAEILQPQASRVNIGTPAEGKYPLSWQIDQGDGVNTGDMFTAYDNTGNPYAFYYTDTEEKGIGSFSCYDEVMPEEISYAIANYDAMSGMSMYLPLGESPWGGGMDGMVTNGPTGAKIPMYGTMKDGKLQFQQVAGLLHLKLKGEFEIGDKVSVTCDENNYIGGFVTIDATTAPSDPTLKIDMDMGLMNSEVSYKLNVAANNKSAEAYIVLPIGTYKFLNFKVVRQRYVGNIDQIAETSVKSVTRNSGIQIEKKLYPLDMTFAKIVLPRVMPTKLPADYHKTEWQVNDGMQCFNSIEKYKDGMYFEVDIDDKNTNGLTGAFNTSGTYERGQFKYAVYPSDNFSAAEAAGTLNVSIPSTFSNFAEVLRNVPMFGNITTKGIETCDFTPLMALLQIKLNEKTWEGIDKKGGNLAIQIESTDKPITMSQYGDAEFKLVNNRPELTLPTDKAAKKIIIKKGYYDANTDPAYVALPVGTGYNTGLTIKIIQQVTNKEWNEVKTLGTFNPENGTIEAKSYTLDLTSPAA